jgi:cytosine/adenosine deaminase-related metal-dependent hydrolase
MALSLIRGKYIICKIRSRTEADVIEDGAVVQRDGTILAVGPYAALAQHYQPDETFGSAEHVVMPGLVNSHHHVGLTPFQLGSPDYPLELWFASRMAARSVDPYLDTLYAAFEMLESGITTVQHLHGVRIAPVSRVLEAAEQILKAYDDIGMRVSYSYALRDQNRLVYEADEAFVQRLPASLAADVAAYLRGQAMPLADHLALFTDLWERWHSRERTRIQLAPANLHWCSDDAPALRDYAETYRVGRTCMCSKRLSAGIRASVVPGPRPCGTSPTWDCSARSSPSAMGCGSPTRTSTSSPAPAPWSAIMPARTCACAVAWPR